MFPRRTKSKILSKHATPCVGNVISGNASCKKLHTAQNRLTHKFQTKQTSVCHNNAHWINQREKSINQDSCFETLKKNINKFPIGGDQKWAETIPISFVDCQEIFPVYRKVIPQTPH